MLIRNVFGYACVLTLLGLFLSITLVKAQTYCTLQEVRTEVLIYAPIDSVWNKLMAVKDYPQWNPFIQSISGTIKLHRYLKIQLQIDDSTQKEFKVKVLELKPNTRFAWGGSVLFFFKAKHYFYLEAQSPTATKLVQGEYWKGWFGKKYGQQVYRSAYANFTKMNIKLKLLLEHQ